MESTLSGNEEIVRLSVGCGWCMTNDCEHCKPELKWYNKLYMCGCKKCCDGHVPPIGLESKNTSEGENNEADN